MAKNSSGFNLNGEQIKAIRHGKGPLLIIAGAGTGKTTVVTERIKYLIEKELAKPQEILALTFTEKAAREMEERVDVALPYGYIQLWISTFHSFSDRILRSEVLNIGLDPRYKLMTEAETVQFVRKHLFDFDLNYFRPLGNPTKFIAGMMQHFSRLQDEDISPNDYVAWTEKLRISKTRNLPESEKIETEKYKELAGAYKKYEELKTKESVMDFGDMIVKVLELFRKRPNVLSEYHKRFKYILVDEFQDTNYSQNELVKFLAGKEKNITVVGDDDQAVYKFRGASVSNIVQFRKSFPKTKVIVLSKNYRSNQEILDKSYELIKHNNPDRLEVVENVNKKLISQVSPSKKTKEGQVITFIHKDRVENEAESVAKEILRLVFDPEAQTRKAPLAQDKFRFSDIAILVRANNHSEPFIRAFQRHGIPYQFLGPGRLFRQEEVIDLVSYLKVLYNIDDSASFFRLLSNDYFGIEAKDLIRLTNFAKKYNYSLFEASEKLSEAYISEDAREKIGKVVGIVNNHLKLVKKETAGQILYYFLQDTGLLTKLLNPDTPDAQKRAQNISKLFDKLKTYEVDHEDSTVPVVVDWIELSSELGESPLAADTDWVKVNAVNILTVHSAKGLEFPIVFLVNLVSQRFPTIDRREQIPLPDEIIKEVLPSGDYHLQEERRLFYVGMTRAKDLLYMTAADYYGEAKREKKLSPFIFEALGDEALGSEQSTVTSEQLSFLDYKPHEFATPITDHQPQTTGLHIDYLSYSQIDTFSVCPLHYKLRYILRVPTPPSASQSFGTSIHATLKNFFMEVKSGQKPGEKLMFDIYEKDWVREGFTSREHEKQFFEKGKIYLHGFLNEGFDPHNPPELLEQKFTLPLPLKVGERSLKIGGVMDRVDILKGDQIRILDYKTAANIPTKKEVDKNLQLTFYALAATTLKENPFPKNPADIKLSLYFLDQQEELQTVRTKEQLEDAIGEIYKIRKEIETSEFRCSGHMFCQNTCEYSLFCRADLEK